MEQTQSIYISIQDHTGDRKLKLNWDPADQSAQNTIKDMFMDLQRNGYRFFSVKKVLGIFPTKGKEVKTYDPSLGELIYEKGTELSEKQSSLEMYEVEKSQQEKYEEPKNFNPTNENMDTSRDYVATKPMRAG